MIIPNIIQGELAIYDSGSQQLFKREKYKYWRQKTDNKTTKKSVVFITIKINWEHNYII